MTIASLGQGEQGGSTKTHVLRAAHWLMRHGNFIFAMRHCATSQKVMGLIPDGVIAIFHWHNPSGRTLALGLTQPITEMSTRNISLGVKAAGV